MLLRMIPLRILSFISPFIRYWFIATAVVALLLVASCAVHGPHFAKGELLGEPLALDLGSDEARRLFVGEPAPVVEAMPTTEDLRRLTRERGVDFATLHFARAVYADERNRRWQNRSNELRGDIGWNRATTLRIDSIFPRFHLLVVPGWLWKSRPETGADMALPRKVLARLGLTSTFVNTDENGTVVQNAKTVERAMRNSAKLDKPVIVISASKGGADTAFALGKYYDPARMSHIKGWLNIGGIIDGSAFVQYAIDDPQRWSNYQNIPVETPREALLDLHPDVASPRLAGMEFPQNLLIVNYAGLPFSNTLSRKSRYSYSVLAAHGPNDGSALMTQLLVPDAATVLEPGIDHFMGARRAMTRALALLILMMECAEERASCPS